MPLQFTPLAGGSGLSSFGFSDLDEDALAPEQPVWRKVELCVDVRLVAWIVDGDKSDQSLKPAARRLKA